MERYTVSADELKAECLRRKYLVLLDKPDVFPSKANWDFIIEHRMHGLGSKLYRKYLVSWVLEPADRLEANRLALSEFPRYLQAVERRYALQVVYADITSAPEATTALIAEAQLFDAPTLMSLVDSEPDFVIANLGALQPAYDGDDADNMRALLSRLRELPRRSDKPRGAFFGFGKSQEYAITDEQVAAIDAYADRYDALIDLLG